MDKGLRSVFRRQDWFLSGVVAVITGLGLLTIHSVSPTRFLPQLLWFAIGLAVVFLVASFDFRPLITYRWFVGGIYFLAITLLIATAIFAPTIREAKSWIVFGSARFQTSEFAKVALIMALALFFARAHIGIARIKNVLISFAIFAIPAALVFLQPDLGSALIFFVIWVGFLFVSGIPWRHLLIGFLIFVALGLGAWQYALQDYQKERVIGFLDSSYDPLGVNYSVIQSKIAIGSAGFFGKGYGQGTQAQLGFLPESYSDFIFAAFIEEWGLFGGLVLVGLFSFLLIRILVIGFKSHNNFFRLFCLGVVIMFFSQFSFNVGSALGFLPVTGVTFPFFSYGGSSLFVNMLILGVIQGIVVRTSFFKEYD
jgi:rod shape determining protein RodA